jgi:hypothetical protein
MHSYIAQGKQCTNIYLKELGNILPGRNSAEEVQQETLIKGVLNCVHFIWLLRAAEAEKKETFKIEKKIKGTVELVRRSKLYKLVHWFTKFLSA